MTEEFKDTVLDPEIMDKIVPFSGTREEMSPSQQLIADGGALQKVETKYTTAVAVQKPRSISRVSANVLEEAKLAGTSFYYRWEVWDKTKGRKVPIQGPSIDLAMCIARNYGNCAIDVQMNETLTHYIFKGVFIDLETGFTVPRLFRQRKSQSLSDKMDRERQEDIVFQIGQSKAQRNAIVKAAPGWLVDQAIQEAERSELAKIKPENIALARARVLEFFGKHGADQESIEKSIGRPADKWTAQDIVNLRASATALQEGRVSVQELFEAKEPENTKPDPKTEQTTEDPTKGGKFNLWPALKNLRVGFGGEVWKLMKSHKINEATKEDLVEMRAKWARGKETSGHPFPLDVQANPILVTCPKGGLNEGDEMDLMAFCMVKCGQYENRTCQTAQERALQEGLLDPEA